MLSREDIRNLIRDAGLPHLVDELMNETKPAIHITRKRVTDESTLELGASKLGGSPDLPPNFVWPYWNDKPLTFIGQIRLSDVAPYDVEKLLPSTGWLSFFYEASEQPWGYEPQHRGSFRVVYVENEDGSLERFPHPTVQEKFMQINAFHPCAIELSSEITFSPDAIEKLSLENLTLFSKVESTMNKTLQPMHHLLGYSEPIQGQMELECQLVTNGISLGDGSGYEDPRCLELEQGASDWRLLLQIDTDDSDDGFGPIWGDVGRIYYWIQKQALDTRSFDNCWLVLQCS